MAINSFSFKVDQQKKESMIAFYQYCKKEINTEHLEFRAVDDEFSIQIYKNNTVLIQGKNAEKEYAIWNPEQAMANVGQTSSKENLENVYDHAGSDEVGCGDYFGPFVVASALVRKEDYALLSKLGIRDSKQLTDKSIAEIAPELMKHIKVKICIINNAKYNVLQTQQNYNLNKMKAYLHNFALYKLVHENHFQGPIIVDQFCEERLYYRYLYDYKTKEIQRGITFTTKAENKFLAVACASIVARYTFINKIKEMEEKLKIKIPLGAGKEVDEKATLLARELGIEGLKNYVKYHFANTKKVLAMLHSHEEL